MYQSKKILLFISLAFISSYTDAEVTKRQITDSVSLNEVVVQASRDNTKLKKMPVSVSVLSAKQIQELGINNLTDVTSSVANLFMPDYGSKLTSPIYIRGIGSRTNAPSVGLYVDNVPYFEKAAFNFDFFDISRIEVLRGPQGTQYGRNTMAGIVNILTKSPVNYQGTDVSLQLGNYGSYQATASHYGKSGNKFAYSLALNYRHNDGFFRNSFRLNEKVDNLDSYGSRNRLIWNMSERFSIENIVSFENSQQGGYPYAVYNPTTRQVANVAYNQRSGYKRNLLSDALVMSYNANKFDLKSTTSCQYLSDNQFIDQDFSIDSTNFAVQKQNQYTFSQEITINSKNQKRYDWLLGVYGFRQQLKGDVNVDTYKPKKFTVKKYNDNTINGAAIFHQSTIKDFVVKNMNLIAGVRADVEKSILNYEEFGVDKKLLPTHIDTIYKPVKSFEVSPKTALNYQLNQTNFYTSVARGYKTGGFNSVYNDPKNLTFEPEYSWTYEAGVKSSFFKNLLYAECSLFYINWKNQQITETLPGKGNMLRNAGHTASKGFELSLNTASIKGFSLMGSYGFTDARFLANAVDSLHNYNGKRIPYVPQNTLAVQLKKNIDIRNSPHLDRIVLSTLYKGTGPIYFDDANTYRQDYYGLLDARICFIKGNIQFDIWGTNLTNSSYQAYHFKYSKNEFVQLGKPFQAGIKLSVNF